MVIYKNTDFTEYVYDLAITSMNITFDTSLNSFFSTHDGAYSAVVYGKMRADYDDFYNYTI